MTKPAEIPLGGSSHADPTSAGARGCRGGAGVTELPLGRGPGSAGGADAGGESTAPCAHGVLELDGHLTWNTPPVALRDVTNRLVAASRELHPGLGYAFSGMA